MSHLLRPVNDWTEAELRKALADHEAGYPKLQYGALVAVKARLEAAQANRALAVERTEVAKQKRMLLAFVDTTSKPKGSIDARSVKHAAIDATMKKGGPTVLTLAMLVAGYEWLVKYEILPKGIPDEYRGPALAVAVSFAAGWWLIGFAIRLNEKWNSEYGGDDG